MLKMTRSSNSALSNNNNEDIGGGKDKNLSKSKKSKTAKSRTQTRIGAMGEPIFLTFNIRKAFNPLQQAFIKVPILQYFDLGYYIRIKTNTSGYAIGVALSQLTSD